MERREGREQCQNVGKGDRVAGSGRPGNALNANGREQMTAVHLPRPCLCPCPHPRLSVPHRSRRSFLSNLSLIPRPTPSLLPCFPLFSLRALRAFLPPSSYSIPSGSPWRRAHASPTQDSTSGRASVEGEGKGHLRARRGRWRQRRHRD